MLALALATLMALSAIATLATAATVRRRRRAHAALVFAGLRRASAEYRRTRAWYYGI